MLEGLEISILNWNDFLIDNFDFRLDAEYFLKENLQKLKTLYKRGYEKVSSFGYVTDGIHTSIDYCDESDINLFSATTPRENYFDLSRQVFISKIAHELNPRTALRENDIIISTVGTIGNCAVVNKNVLPANSDRHVGIIRLENDAFFPRYVSTFLLSKYGRFQTWRESTGNVQLNLFLYRIRTLKIAKLSKAFQEKIENLVLLNDFKKNQAQQTYAQAETFLLETLGLNNFEPSKEPVNIKSFAESFGTSGRLDAEYYQKKYDEIEEKISSHKHINLENAIIKIDTGEYSPAYYQKNEKQDLVFYVRSTNIKGGLIEFDDNYYVPRKDFTRIAKKGDIVTARVGSVGVFGEVRQELDGSVYSDNVLCFKLPNEYNPSVYTLLFNTKIYYDLIDRLARGSVQQRLNQETLKEIQIPIIDSTVQQSISQLIESSLNLKYKSKLLLELAKTAVEKAIEENETVAMAYIHEELKKMEVELP